MKRQKLSLSEKLNLLHRVNTLGSVPQACQELGVSIRLYYKIKKQQLENQLEPKNTSEKQPLRTADAIVQRIIELSLLHPESCRTIQAALEQEDYYVSAQTIQKNLKRYGLGSQRGRFQHLVSYIQKENLELKIEQQLFIAQFNPAWLEWEQRPLYPGDLCIAYTHFLGRWPILGKVFLFVVLEAWSGWVSGLVAHEKMAQWSVQLVEDNLLPLSMQFGFGIEKILTSDTDEYYALSFHAFQHLLHSKNIQPVLSTTNGAQVHGYTWRFQQWVEKNKIPQWKAAHYLFLDELNDVIQQDFQVYNNGLAKSIWPEYYADFPQWGAAPLEKLTQFQATNGV